MQKATTQSARLYLSLFALTSVFMHATQFDAAIVLAVNNIDKTHGERMASKLTKTSKNVHTHIDMISFSGDTFNLRSQPPAARPREDDESDQKSRAYNDDGLGDMYSTTST